MKIFELFYSGKESVGETSCQNSLSNNVGGNGHTKIFVAGLETSDGG
jgi:hypothetical protein